MARKRMEEPALKSWEEVDAALKKIIEAESELDMITASMNKEIAETKQAAEDLAAPWRDEIKKYELQVKEFTAAARGDLKGKSRELTFGTVGFRASTRIILPKVLEPVIEALKRRGMLDCISTKETVNKDMLRTYEEDAILAVGGNIKKEDAFWYETKREALKIE